MASPIIFTRCSKETARKFQDYLNDSNLIIKNAIDMPGSKLGDNYTSLIIRTEIIGTYKGSEPAKVLNLEDLFRIEAHVYKNVLPVLGSFGPECIHADNNSIVMEDLATKGYACCNRLNFLDRDHIVFALKKLAELHTSALTLKMKKPHVFEEIVDPLEEIIYKDSDLKSPISMCCESTVETTIKFLKQIKPQTSEMQSLIEHLTSYVGRSYRLMYELFHTPKEKYDTICHGDPWNNNLLYLHDDENNIIDMKLVDYQIVRYGAVSMDILYLIYSSAQISLIETNFDSLIKGYHDEFMKLLREKQADEEILTQLGMEWLQAELELYAFYGALSGCSLTFQLLMEDADAAAFEEIKNESVDSVDKFISSMSQDASAIRLERIKRIALHYYRRYVLEK